MQCVAALILVIVGSARQINGYVWWKDLRCGTKQASVGGYTLYRPARTNFDCFFYWYCWFYVNASEREHLVLILHQPLILRNGTAQLELIDQSVVPSEPLEVFGTEKLETALQLQDIPNASWDAIKSSGAWRRIEASANSSLPPVSAVLIPRLQRFHESIRVHLQFSGQTALNLTTQFLEDTWEGRRFLNHIAANTIACNDIASNCSVWSQEGSISGSQYIRNRFATIFSVMLPTDTDKLPSSIGSIKCCENGTQHCDKVVFNLRNIPKVTAPSVWVLGKPAKVSISLDRTALLIGCLVATSTAFLLPKERRTLFALKISRSGSSTLHHDEQQKIELTSKIPVTRELQDKRLVCHFKLRMSTSDPMWVPYVTFHDINNLAADPCVTDVDLGSSPYWREGEVRSIRVTSRNCSIWSASHTCWLRDAGGKLSDQQLIKIQQENFSSVHELSVSRWMGQRDWLVRCSVNQSGIGHSYDDARSHRLQQPDVYYTGDVTFLNIFVTKSSKLRLTIVALGRPAVTISRCYGRRLNGSVINFELRQKPSTNDNEQQLWTFEGPESGGASAPIHCIALQISGSETIFEKEYMFPMPLAGPEDIAAGVPTQTFTFSGLLPYLISSLATAAAIALLFAIIKKRHTLSSCLQGQQPLNLDANAEVQTELPLHSGLRYTDDNGAYTYAETEPATQNLNTPRLTGIEEPSQQIPSRSPEDNSAYTYAEIETATQHLSADNRMISSEVEQWPMVPPRHPEDNSEYTYADVDTASHSTPAQQPQSASETLPPIAPRQFEENSEYSTGEPTESVRRPAAQYQNFPLQDTRLTYIN